MKGFWRPRIFYLQVNYDGTIPHQKLISLPSRYGFAQPVRYGRLTAQSKGDPFSLYISRPPSSQHIKYKTFKTVLICDDLPCCHWKGAGFDSLKQDKIYPQTFKICIQNSSLPNAVPNIFIAAFPH